MKTGLPLYEDLMSKYNDKFEQNCQPSFMNLLWQLIINESWSEKKTHCFTPVLSTCGGEGYEVGIIETKESGFYPTHVHLLANFKYDEAFDILNELNEDMFGLLPRATDQIMMESMRTV